ncbi:MAG: hypothetical protein ACYDBQ_10405 [Thermoplasmatota archaeon]
MRDSRLQTAGQAAVSAVLSGILLVGIVSAVVVTFILIAHVPAPETKISSGARADMVQGAYIVTLTGPDAIPVAGAHISYVADGIPHDVPLSEFAPSLRDSATWQVGEGLCLAGPVAGCNQPAAGKVEMTLATSRQVVFVLDLLTAPGTSSTSPAGATTSGGTPSGSPSPTTAPPSSSAPPGSSAPSACQGANVTLVSYSYVVNGHAQSRLQDGSGPLVHQGDSVTVNFDLAGCNSARYSFVSYKATPNFDLTLQSVYSQATGNFSAGASSMSIVVPPCFFQIDFVTGPVIQHFYVPPDITYHARQSWIDGIQSGNSVCT